MAFSSAVRVDVLRVLAFGSVSTTFAKLGTAFTHRMRMVKITNSTNGDLVFSFTNGSTPLSDKTADNIIIPPTSFTLYDFATNSELSGSPFVFQEGTQVWVRQSDYTGAATATSGSVFLECVYGKGE